MSFLTTPIVYPTNTLMTSPSMPCSNDSSGITTFTTTMLSIVQTISWIGFHLPVYVSFACARGRSFRWNRITQLKRNDDTTFYKTLGLSNLEYPTFTQFTFAGFNEQSIFHDQGCSTLFDRASSYTYEFHWTKK
ncbi:hypothetical protein G4B88_010218 [Cannabis sativa]|uniref:Uncharacterized protein n=1 Tax=Cannabis sativa TaxID=3483 RepID=A0A7J6I616_CANSA|nr:hypothetical protein G4B88_010218 [Cannabis sativa]